MKSLNLNYILSKFYSVAGSPVFRKSAGVYNASCNICREGKNWLKKQRLFFYPKTKTFHCFNCSKTWNAVGYISESTGLSFQEILDESKSYDVSFEIKIDNRDKNLKSKKNPTLPHDSISLLNNDQIVNYYNNNKHVRRALAYIQERRLNTAINKPLNFYISLTDYIHQNRLIIPFLDQNKKIIFYQSRTLKDEIPKYLGKYNSEKSLYGIENIDPSFEYIFLFEGPIDAMFVKNGVAMGGLTLSDFQKKQLSLFPFHEKIWILDNPKIDESAKNAITNLILDKQKVFKWFNEFKDLNEWAVSMKIDSIDPQLILNSLYN
jgi:hypothetical protein